MNTEIENDTLDLFPPASATTPGVLTSPSADNAAAADLDEEPSPSTPPDPPLAEGAGIQQVSIGWLKPHPFSLQVYGAEATDKDLVESIKALGIQAPLQVTVDGVVISGHRRLNAAKSTNLETVPVYVACPPYASITVEEQILEANRTRVKDNEQKVREFIAYKVIETARAKARCGCHPDLVPNSARGDAGTEHGDSPYLEAALVREVGKARDLAAKKVGMAGSTAADGVKVLAALDRLWAADKYSDYCQLREALLKSIHSALHLGLEHGWIPKPAPKSKGADRAVVSDASGEEIGDTPDHAGEPGDSHSLEDTVDDAVDVMDTTGAPATDEARTPTAQTGCDLYVDRPLPTHDAVATPPRTVPPSVDDAPVIPLPVIPPSDAPGHTVAPAPVAGLEDRGQHADGLIPANLTAQAAAAVSRRDFPGCDDPEILDCSRRFVGRVAAMLNEQAREFPGVSGHDLCRALGIANTKIQVAMKWL